MIISKDDFTPNSMTGFSILSQITRIANNLCTLNFIVSCQDDNEFRWTGQRIGNRRCADKDIARANFPDAKGTNGNRASTGNDWMTWKRRFTSRHWPTKRAEEDVTL